MKKMLMFVSAILLSSSLLAQENAVKPTEENEAKTENTRELSPVWPAWFAICQWPRAADVVGLRLTIPFSTSQDNVTGFDIGFWGRSDSFEGMQFNLLRNDVKDEATGLQVGLYNSVGFGALTGIQIGLWNESIAFSGIECGLVNVTGSGRGFQVGLINRAETLNGYQVGLINIIRDSELAFFPLVNIGF